MSKHEYTPEQALDTLLRKIREKDLTLEGVMRSAIDLGKDITEEQRLGRKKVRKYRKTVPFTHDEALRVSLDVLQAYFVDLPRCINSAFENFKSTAVSYSRRDPPAYILGEKRPAVPEHVGEEKPLEIELQTMTQISRTPQQTFPLKPWEEQLTTQQLDNLNAVLRLFDFTEE